MNILKHTIGALERYSLYTSWKKWINGQKDLFDDGGQNYSDVTKNILQRAGEREAHYSLQIQTRAGLAATAHPS